MSRDQSPRNGHRATVSIWQTRPIHFSPPQWLYWVPWATYRYQFSRISRVFLYPDVRQSSSASLSRPPDLFLEQELLRTRKQTGQGDSSSNKHLLVLSRWSHYTSTTNHGRLCQTFSGTHQEDSGLTSDPPQKGKESLADIALPINKALLDPAKTIWQTPATILPTCKRAD